MNRMIVWAAGLLAAALVIAHEARAAADPVFGDWLTVGGTGKVRVAPCPAAPAQACGTIVWLNDPNGPDGKTAHDANNPNPALQSRPILGLPLIGGFHLEAPGRWNDGTIYDPNEGKTYRSKMAIGPGGTLRVSGCVLVFCKAQTWTRAD